MLYTLRGGNYIRILTIHSVFWEKIIYIVSEPVSNNAEVVHSNSWLHKVTEPWENQSSPLHQVGVGSTLLEIFGLEWRRLAFKFVCYELLNDHIAYVMHLIKQKLVFQQAIAPALTANCVMEWLHNCIVEYIEDWPANSSNILVGYAPLRPCGIF